jgi:hypothetical protein
MTMDKQFVATSASPHILLEVSGNLQLKGQDSSEVKVKSDNPEDITLEAHDEQVTIHSKGDCVVRVPRLATIQVQAVHGDATIKALEGELTIEKVDGNLAMRNLGETRINRINGDLSAKNVDGNLIIDSISGDVSARGVQGDFAITGRLNGNLNLSDVGGSAKASAEGNMMLNLDPAPAHQFEFTARGNLFCRLPEDASVEISVPKASQVRVDLPGIHASASVQTPYALTLGEGDAKLSLSADGNVVLDTHAPNWELEDFDIDIGADVSEAADAISQQINQQVDAQVRMIEDQLNAQLSDLSMRLSAAKLTEDQARRIEERARQASERAASRAQEKMRRAQEKMEQKMTAVQRKMEMRTRERDRERVYRHEHRHWSMNIPNPPLPPTPPGEPVSDDERLMILRMLQEKKITTEEAEQLLSALEGKE